MTEPGAGSSAGAMAVPGVERSAVGIAALTVASRATGYLRIIVVAAVLGASYLGNVYQTANSVPNVLFELLAAGALQAVVIPTVVELVDRGAIAEAERVIGAVLGLSWAALAALVAVGLAAGPLVVGALLGGIEDPVARADATELGVFFLWFFLPQALLYALGAVAGAVLNAHHRFAAAAAAPVASNVVVIATYLVFALMRDGEAPSLDLATSQQVVLAGGTTLGVVALCLVPALAVRRGCDVRLRPNLDHRQPAVRALVRRGGWAMVFVAASQVLLLVVLRLANADPGGVVVFGLGQVLFLLPHALFAVPVLTTRFPLLARAAHQGDRAGYWVQVADGVRSITFLVLPAAAVIAATAPAIARLTVYGEASSRVDDVAATVAAFSPGIVAYGLLLFLTRALYADGDTRTPALVNLGVTAVGAVLMVVGAVVVDMTDRVAAIAGAFAAAQVVGAVALWGHLQFWGGRRGDPPPPLARPLAARAAGGVAAGAVAWLVAQALPADGRLAALATVAVAAVAGAAAHLAVVWLAGGPAPALALRTLGAGERGGG